MRISGRQKIVYQSGVSLIELIVFLVVVGVASGALMSAYNYSVLHNADPMAQVRCLQLAQSKLDEILALKYDANTPTGGIPACSSTGGVACNNTTDADMNDVDDYNGYSDTPYTYSVASKNGATGATTSTNYSYTRSVTVTTDTNQKLISVTVTTPQNVSVTLSAYKANF